MLKADSQRKAWQARFIMAYFSVLRLLARVILAFVGRVEISGKENLPPAGPYITVVNHLSKADSALVLLALPKQRIRVFAANKWRPHPIYGPILSLGGAIFVKRGQVDRKALGEAISSLQAGQVLGMAPEGTRSRTRVLQKARQGAAYIANRAQVPVLPIGIANSEKFQDNILKLRRTHFKVAIGEPFELPDFGRRVRAKELSAYSELIMARIAYLLPQRYHGYYADSLALAALQDGKDPWPAACQAAGVALPITPEQDKSYEPLSPH